MKAFLVAHNKKFSKTHDLLKLLTDCSKVDGSFELVHDLLRELNPYAVAFRYPGEESTKGEAKLAIKAAMEFRQFFQTKLRT